MRFRVSQSRFFRWARPAAVETEGELLREAAYDRLLYGAVYPRPARERRTAGGIVPEGGFALGPAHLEAVLRLCGAEDGIQEAGA